MIRFLAIAALGLSAAAVAQAPPAGLSFDQFATGARGRLMALDADHDGKLSKEEFAAQPAMARRHGDGSRLFARLDTNQDGLLDAGEINALLARRFARMDANHDGVLTADERQAMRGPAAAEQ